MNALHLATFDTHGGAAVAALRLVEGLQRRGHRARMLVRDKATAHPLVQTFSQNESSPTPRSNPELTQMAWLFSQRARPPRQTSAFSTDLPTYDLASHPLVRGADVIHLHWVTGFVSAYDVRRLQDLGKPIVWTLHDQFPFTGGCHYAGKCRGFMHACARCPQLLPGAQRLASLALDDKRRFIDPTRLIVVGPSRWMAESARRSRLFRRARIEVVPYGIDVDAQRPVGREQARVSLGIPADAAVVLASSINHDDPRKGHAQLAEALSRLRASATPPLRRRLLLLTAGHGHESGEVGGVQCLALGGLAADDPKLALTFLAADAFALPSLEDNLPNTLLESMAAGTPVVACATGGIPDVIRDGVNGRLVAKGDIRAFATALLGLLSDDGERRRLGDAGLAHARARFDWKIQAEAYERIYADARTRTRARAVSKRGLSVDAFADAPGLRKLLDDTRAARAFTLVLRQEIDQLQSIIASRGGEIRDHLSAIEEHQRERRGLADARAKDQEEITRRGGEIRELRKALGDAQQAGARRKEVLSHLMRAHARGSQDRDRPAVGIFGVGESGRRVLEAAVLLDCRIVWLSDNNVDLHGSTDLGIAVLRPEAIPGISFDAAIIASAHRDAIKRQLLQLGVDPERIIAPDVTKTDAELLDELRKKLEARRPTVTRRT